MLDFEAVKYLDLKKKKKKKKNKHNIKIGTCKFPDENANNNYTNKI